MSSSQAATSAQPGSTASPTGIVDNQKRVCAYDVNTVSGLAGFASATGRSTVDCAMVYDGPPDWANWVNPWFIHVNNADTNWAQWVQNSPANDRRQLIISQPLIPSGLAGTNWLADGAAGDFTTYATQFAQNLVATGVGDAVIRLSWEMNGTWNDDNIGSTATSYGEWVSFWRQTVFAMRAVPGAHFVFVWCPNNGYRDIPLADYYPGNDVVDVIGDDAYDADGGWNTVYNQAGGLSTILAFAKTHDKPFALGEWGVGDEGDDPSYISDMASIIANNDVAFDTYFYKGGFASELQPGTQSHTAFVRAFGDSGTSDGPDYGTDVTPVPVASTPSKPVASTPSKPVKTTTRASTHSTRLRWALRLREQRRPTSRHRAKHRRRRKRRLSRGKR